MVCNYHSYELFLSCRLVSDAVIDDVIDDVSDDVSELNYDQLGTTKSESDEKEEIIPLN